jgi:hypothetical protein
MGHDRVVALLGSHRVRIARAWARQTRAVVPRYREVEERALEKGLANLVGAFERVLSGGPEHTLLQSAGGVAQMRLAAGFAVPDLLVATVCFLSVMRRFLVDRAPTVEEGLDDFEAVEAVCLPLLNKITTVFLQSQSDTMPGGYDLSKLQRMLSTDSGPFERFPIEEVVGDASEEETPPGYRSPLV